VNETTKQSINLRLLLHEAIIEKESAVPYPQANDLDKVIGVITHFRSANLSDKESIADFFEFEGRQGDYYANAGVYLGLLRRVPYSTKFALTKAGDSIANSENQSKRNYLLFKQMLKSPSLNAIINLFEKYDRCSACLNVDMLAPIILKDRPELNPITARRRASTILSWLRWMEIHMNFVD
jgi:hypothetical protein